MRFGDVRNELLKRWDIISLVVVVAFGLASIRTFFEDGMLISWDHPVNLVNCYYAARSMLSGGGLFFYDALNNLGWVVNHQEGPGAQLLVTIIHITTGSSDINLSYKLGVAFSYLVMAPAIYVATRALTGSKVAAVASAFSSVVVTREESSLYDAGLLQVYETGMWSQRLGIAFALLSVGFLVLGMRREYKVLRRLALSSLSALFAAATILTHMMTGFGLAVVFVTLLVFLEVVNIASSGGQEKRAEALVKGLKALGIDLLVFAVAVSIGVGISASWISGYLESASYRPLPNTYWSVGAPIYVEPFYSLDPLLVFLGLLAVSASIASCRSRSGVLVAAVSLSSFFLMQLLAVLNLSDGFLGIRVLYSAVLLLIAAGTTRRAQALALMASSLLLLYLASGPSTYTILLPGATLDLGKFMPYSHDLDYAKLSALARFLLIVLSADGFAICAKALYGQVFGSGAEEKRYGYLAGLVLGVLVFAYLNAQISAHTSRTDLFHLGSQERRFRLEYNFTLVQSLREVLNWIAREVPTNTRTLYQDTFTDLGDWKSMPVSHYVYLSSYLTGKPSLGGIYETRHVAQIFAYTAGSTLFSEKTSSFARDVEKLYNMTGELGVSYIVAFDPELRNALEAEGGLFKEVNRAQLFSVFERVGFAPIAYVEEGGSVRGADSFKADVNYIEVEVKGARANSSLVLRILNYPGWSATVNGMAAGIEVVYANVPSVYRVGGQLVYNIKLPYVKLKLQEGDNKVVLRFGFKSPADAIVAISALALLGINVTYLAMRLMPFGIRGRVKAASP